MRTTLLVALAVAASLVLPIQALAAGPVTIDLTAVGGGGLLSNNSHFGVEALSLAVTTPRRSVSIQNGSLVVDGVRTKCKPTTVVNCLDATLDCDDSSTHQVTAGVPGVSLGSLDGFDVTQGFILMKCFSR